MILTMAMAAALAVQTGIRRRRRGAPAPISTSLFLDGRLSADGRGRAGAQGTAGFRLVIGADGAVTGCTITRSSGDAALDAATCAILLGRARYEPARDAAGRAMPGQGQVAG